MKILTIIVSILIVIAVLIPGSNIPNVDFIGFDKFVHIAMFASWAVAVRYDYRSLRPWVVFIFGLAFSLFTEILQLFVEGRSFDLYDMVADSAGLLMGLLVAPMLIKLLTKVFRNNS